MDQIYTMKELIKQCDVSEDTLRYYEKIGLLPLVNRKKNGHRIYRDVHKETILMIKCLKKTGMSLQELKPILLTQQNRSKETEYDWDKLLIDYQKQIKKQQEDLQKVWDMIEHKRLKDEKFGYYS
ncbi:MerR family transcriptional regulator [Priestia aryabhattai]|uniref:MerR family transcriptional regulator n=1 Tax=Priestia aryabhattai TaxID=412384 RepID=UPI003CF4085D